MGEKTERGGGQQEEEKKYRMSANGEVGSEKEKWRQEGGAEIPEKEMAEEIGVDERGGRGRVTLDAQSWYMVIGVANRDIVE